MTNRNNNMDMEIRELTSLKTVNQGPIEYTCLIIKKNEILKYISITYLHRIRGSNFVLHPEQNIEFQSVVLQDILAYIVRNSATVVTLCHVRDRKGLVRTQAVCQDGRAVHVIKVSCVSPYSSSKVK